MSRVSMTPRDVGDRLRRTSALSDLTTARRLATKVDMSPDAVTRRLTKQSMLRDSCLRFAALGRVHHHRP